MIKLYGDLDTCPKCEMIHKRFKDNNINFNFINDKNTIAKLAEQHGIGAIPFGLKDGKVLSFTDLLKIAMARGE